MNKKKILITGGCGYVGSLLSNTLAQKGYKITVIDTLWFGNNLIKNKNIIFVILYCINNSCYIHVNISIIIFNMIMFYNYYLIKSKHLSDNYSCIPMRILFFSTNNIFNKLT